MQSAPTFIDLFAGCGGLSLGLMQAGWNGLFAIEYNPMAFETLKYNLIDRNDPGYSWPDWLPKEPHDIKGFLKNYSDELRMLKGTVDLIAGGPPCQGFSFAGKRDNQDERNKLFKEYLKIVKFIQPKIVFMENVEGITVSLGKNRKHLIQDKCEKPYSHKIVSSLQRQGYKVFTKLVEFQDYGVPQLRKRFIILGFRIQEFSNVIDNPFALLKNSISDFLEEKGLPCVPISLQEAISDLEFKHGYIESPDTKGFRHGLRGRCQSPYQSYIRRRTEYNEIIDSHRFVNHTDVIVERFNSILNECRRGVQLNDNDRSKFKLRKRCTYPADPDKPSPTLTTLPDDLIHYNEPRVLTVREFARIQSFPDWYVFRSKYTTGGNKRKSECPRYTQVGNAVPPMFAEVVGRTLRTYIEIANFHLELCVGDSMEYS